MSTALYAGINLGDLPLALVSIFNTACCVTVILLALQKRLAVRRLSATFCVR